MRPLWTLTLPFCNWLSPWNSTPRCSQCASLTRRRCCSPRGCVWSQGGVHLKQVCSLCWLGMLQLCFKCHISCWNSPSVYTLAFGEQTRLKVFTCVSSASHEGTWVGGEKSDNLDWDHLKRRGVKLPSGTSNSCLYWMMCFNSRQRKGEKTAAAGSHHPGTWHMSELLHKPSQ